MHVHIQVFIGVLQLPVVESMVLDHLSRNEERIVGDDEGHNERRGGISGRSPAAPARIISLGMHHTHLSDNIVTYTPSQ